VVVIRRLSSVALTPSARLAGGSGFDATLKQWCRFKSGFDRLRVTRGE